MILYLFQPFVFFLFSPSIFPLKWVKEEKLHNFNQSTTNGRRNYIDKKWQRGDEKREKRPNQMKMEMEKKRKRIIKRLNGFSFIAPIISVKKSTNVSILYCNQTVQHWRFFFSFFLSFEASYTLIIFIMKIEMKRRNDQSQSPITMQTACKRKYRSLVVLHVQCSCFPRFTHKAQYDAMG